MAKLIDQNAAELAGTLVSIAGAIKSFVEDEAFMTALSDASNKQVNGRTHAALVFLSDLTPYILSDKHLKDTIAILAAIEGEDPKKMLKKNGAEVLKDAIAAWNGQLKDFFLQLGVSVQTR